MLTFGTTMRITSAIGYSELRDSIAMDWSKYFLKAFPHDRFLFIPNIQNKAIDYFKNWDINVLVLSGGDDFGIYYERDNTEISLLNYALKNEIPVIAICRGMQLVHHFFGGKIVKGINEFITTHKSSKHKISIENKIKEVNSFHTNYIKEDTLNEKFIVFARCMQDNTIEGFRNDQILAMMWHPERDLKVSVWNKLLIKTFLNDE
jgi:putative glutamine amidotransferase